MAIKSALMTVCDFDLESAEQYDGIDE